MRKIAYIYIALILALSLFACTKQEEAKSAAKPKAAEAPKDEAAKQGEPEKTPEEVEKLLKDLLALELKYKEENGKFVADISKLPFIPFCKAECRHSVSAFKANEEEFIGVATNRKSGEEWFINIRGDIMSKSAMKRAMMSPKEPAPKLAPEEEKAAAPEAEGGAGK